MTLQKLLSLIKHPKTAYEEASSRAPTREGIYIACEVYDGETKTYKLIFINTILELTEFIPVLHLSDIAILDEKQTLTNTDDYTEVYDYLNKFRNLKYFTAEVLEDLVGDYGFINVLNVGLISTFFNVSLETVGYIKANTKIVDYESMVKIGINMTEYYILAQYVKKFDAMPSDIPMVEFFEYLASLNAQ